MPPEMKDIYREFLIWQASVVALKITPAFLYLFTLDRAIVDLELPREKAKTWEVLTKLPLPLS